MTLILIIFCIWGASAIAAALDAGKPRRAISSHLRNTN